LPDYWVKLRGPAYPDYETVTIVEDPWRLGYDPAKPGHCLLMTYSGKDVGVETVVPKAVDAQLAYEISAFAKLGAAVIQKYFDAN